MPSEAMENGKVVFVNDEDIAEMKKRARRDKENAVLEFWKWFTLGGGIFMLSAAICAGSPIFFRVFMAVFGALATMIGCFLLIASYDLTEQAKNTFYHHCPNCGHRNVLVSPFRYPHLDDPKGAVSIYIQTRECVSCGKK